MTERIPFTFLGVAWELLVYETTERHGDVTPRAAAYCLADAVPRGPRRTWTVLETGALETWGPNYEGDWPELDEAARGALRQARTGAAS